MPIVLLMTVLNILLLVEYHNVNKRNVELRLSIKMLQKEIYDNFKTHHVNEAKCVNDCKVCNEQGDTVRLSEVIGRGKYVFYIPQTGCTSCLDSELDIILKHLSLTTDFSFFFLADFHNSKELKVFKESFQITQEIYRIIDKDIGIPYSKEGKPFVFFLNDNMRTSNFYNPDRSKPNISDEYYKIITDGKR